MMNRLRLPPVRYNLDGDRVQHKPLRFQLGLGRYQIVAMPSATTNFVLESKYIGNFRAPSRGYLILDENSILNCFDRLFQVLSWKRATS